jgi:hypothetical protein
VLPLDGFAFWVRADKLNPYSVYNGPNAFNSPLGLNTGPGIETPAIEVTVEGSLHYTTTNNQDETEGFSINHVVFTSESEIELLNTVNPKTICIGTIDGIQFAFSRRNMLYRQAGLFHYQGDAVYPSLASQIINFPNQLDARQVVSNSLPVWLTFNQFCPMYPSFLVPEDIVPPWCSVHIEPGDTKALQALPWIDPVTGSHWQLAQDKVRLTFYGLRNAGIIDFMDSVNTWTLQNEYTMGVQSMSIARDEKRTQTELNILAQKKTIDYEVDYYQSSIRSTALQYIQDAFIEQVFVSEIIA